MSQIEVEKKFVLTDEQEKALLDGAEFLIEKKFTDTYYDDDAHSLTKRDIWLRERDGRFELKVPMNVALEERVSDQYRELETDAEIAAFLQLPADWPFADVLREHGFRPFVTMTTTRRKYKKDGYGLDLDAVDFDYRVAEIECMVDEESEVRATTEKIVAYAAAQGITSEVPVRGKVGEYLRRHDPKHFQELVDAKVLR